ncbi:uncharacterized protein LOC100899533 [Galendromus occidentalis]|uniref:Uncharacterized protein LOC100899533 n=1 Tax=Galendromus occidentalis TaxID=34638 RepID=A0AAJ6QN35_9ACAR|nr:uncharacterized protein LOC100899533 [Galendromus occidentalis]
MLPNLRNTLCAARSCVFEQVRNASARSKGNRACRQDGAQKGQEYGYKLRSGQFAKQGVMLVKQRLPRFFPGLNVEVRGEKLSLHAMVPGKVFVTREKVNINPECAVAKHFDDRYMDAVYKKYYHVVPEPQYNKFQLIANI